MAVLTYEQVYSLARKAGLAPAAAVLATAIAKGESGFRTDAMGDVGIQTGKWGPSVGLWQIRSLKAEYGKGTARDASKLTDPTFNAKAMAEVSGLGKNFKPWSVFTSRSYTSYLGQATSVAKTVDGNPGALDKAYASLSGLPVVGGAVEAGVGIGASLAGAAGSAAGAVTDGLEAINPFNTWQGDVQGIAVKSLIVLAGVGLFVAGAVRLVIPAAVNEVRQSTGL